MNSIVRAAPRTAAWTLAEMAASPRVGPTVRCSTTCTGTGRAPARMSRARSSASRSVKSPVMTVWPPPMPCPQATDGSTWGLEITWRSSTMATRRLGSPAGWQAAWPVSSAQRRPPSPRNPIDTCQRAWSCGSSSARASPTASPVRAAEPSRNRPPPSSARTRSSPAALPRPGLELGLAEHRVEGELGSAPDDLDGLGGVVHAGQLDDDPPLPGALQGRLGHAQLVDPAAQHLQSPGHDVAVELAVRTVLGFEDDLGATAQVQAETGRTDNHHPAG